MHRLTTTHRSWLLLALLTLLGTAPAQAQHLAASQDFTLSIHPDGTLWAWGQNRFGQLGLGNSAYQTTPQQVGTGTTWASVSASTNHVVALKIDGTLWTWGYNGFGQLGLGTGTGFQRSPVQVGTASNWASVSAGYMCTLAIRSDGTLWAWGYDGYGETGFGTNNTANQLTPMQVGTATTWQSVSAGLSHALALQTDGSLWAWGWNAYSQLGQGTTTATILASPTRVGMATTWLSASAGAGYSLAVRQDGTLWSWGYNGDGELGLGTTTTQSVPVQVGSATTWRTAAGGNRHALALRQDGTLWGWGHNRYGQLGTGPTTSDQLTPVQVGGGTTWAAVSAGNAHSLALRQDNTLWAWGANYIGQLGAGPGGPQLLPGQITPVPTWSTLGVGLTQALGIRTDGTLWGWGSNDSGQLGAGTTTDQDVPGAAGTATWQSVATSSGASLGIRPDGSLWAWGSNYYGQLGIGTALSYTTTTPVRIGTANNWRSVVIGAFHVLALQTDGSLWAWGQNSAGQLGTGGTATVETTPVRVGNANWLSVGGGLFHSLGVRQDGTLWTWGQNQNGQLGTGASTSAIATTPVQVGTANNWSSVSAGVVYNLAIQAPGTLWAWGRSTYGELGLNVSLVDVFTPTQVGNAANWRYVKAGSQAALGIRQDNTLWVWGENSYGTLGLGHTTDQLVPTQQGTATWLSAAPGSSFGVGIRTDGTCWTWGYNDRGQLGNGLPGSAAPRYIPNGGAALAATSATLIPAWALAPNPARGYVQVLGLPAGPVVVRLYDSQGRLVRTAATATVPTSGLAPGLYLLQATADHATHTLRLAVE